MSHSYSFITWYPTCRRSDTIAAELGGRSHLIHYLKFKQPLYAPVKYVMQTFATWRKLIQDKPDVVLVATPPVFAVLVVWLYTLVSKASMIIDAHTGHFDDSRWTWLSPLSRFLSRRARTTIVTNEFLADAIRSWGAEACIIADVPVNFAAGESADFGPGKHIVVVNTFSIDEPLDHIVRAAIALPQVSFHITGNIKHARKADFDDLPANARFTGWVTEDEYAALLRACDGVMCLTTHDHTMQRGAYEAVSLHKPLITSDWQILRETFSAGTIHIDNSVDAIRDGVQRLIVEQQTLAAQMKELAKLRRSIFDASLKNLQDQLSGN